MTATPPPPPNPHPPNGRNIVVKLVGVGLLTLLLLIPLGLINSLLDERRERRDSAVEEIANSWGSRQQLAGPVVVVPYDRENRFWKSESINGRQENREVVTPGKGYYVILPEKLAIQGQLPSKTLHRGIYETAVYTADLKVSGHFWIPKLADWGVPEDKLRWEEARVFFTVGDLRGIVQTVVLQWDGQSLNMGTGSRWEALPTGLHSPVKFDPRELKQAGRRTEFSVQITMRGSGALDLAPLGRETTVDLQSDWPYPSFGGAFLPEHRQLNATGFKARWKVAHYGRNLPQQWREPEDGTLLEAKKIDPILIACRLLTPVDNYRVVERTGKYGLLFIALVFMTFFLFEMLAALRIHAVQYGLVGAALCLFFLGLLALSEVLPFGPAYLVSSLSTTVLILHYSAPALRKTARSAGLGALLLVVYGYLYIVLQMQDYSLLFGTGGLFAVLATVMTVTRRINWHGRDDAPGQESAKNV